MMLIYEGRNPIDITKYPLVINTNIRSLIDYIVWTRAGNGIYKFDIETRAYYSITFYKITKLSAIRRKIDIPANVSEIILVYVSETIGRTTLKTTLSNIQKKNEHMKNIINRAKIRYDRLRRKIANISRTRKRW